MKTAGIYKIQRIGTDQCYVGSSVNMHRRWNGHRRDLRLGIHHTSRLQNTWNKHGECAFAFEVLQVVEADTKEAMREALWRTEQEWIDRLKPCFNTCEAAGSTLGFKMPADFVARHRALLTGRKATPEEAERLRNLAKGLKRSDETKEKQRQHGLKRGMSKLAIENSAAVRRGKKLPPERVAQMAAAATGRKHKPEVLALRSQNLTPEIREQMGATWRGRKQSPEHLAKRVAAMVATKAAKKAAQLAPAAV